jgi:hypothetical protein
MCDTASIQRMYTKTPHNQRKKQENTVNINETLEGNRVAAP